MKRVKKQFLKNILNGKSRKGVSGLRNFDGEDRGTLYKRDFYSIDQ